MKEHEFTVLFASPEKSEDDCDRLYEAGCSDSSICTSEGVTRIDFHRNAGSLEEAIRFAIGDVQQAGFQDAQVLIEPEALATTG